MVRVDVAVQYATARLGLPHPSTVAAWVRATLGSRIGAAQLTVRFVARAESAALNRRWRGKARPTNVLSFAGDKLPGGRAWLGDIVICVPVVRAEAKTQRKSVNAHLAHMIVHGILHLMGYAHERSAEAVIMEKRETAILRKLGYPDPYRME